VGPSERTGDMLLESTSVDHFGVFWGEVLKLITSGIRDTVKSEVLKGEVALKVQTHECIRVSEYRDLGVGETSCSTSRVSKSCDRENLERGKERSALTGCQVSGIQETNA
jgi:hypothetical protein